MPDDATARAGWVRIKRAGSPADAPTAVVTTEAWEQVWQPKKDTKSGKAKWQLVDAKAEPAPTPSQVPEPVTDGGKNP